MKVYNPSPRPPLALAVDTGRALTRLDRYRNKWPHPRCTTRTG